ncbi:ABC transporter substrate-binding protein [Thermomicrobium sp.]|uniref:ABC transporter substrate-binding protein n=1 Tax=Thermomicrobium sp. TaxID=1969469 RepID=UPI00338E7581
MAVVQARHRHRRRHRRRHQPVHPFRRQWLRLHRLLRSLPRRPSRGRQPPFEIGVVVAQTGNLASSGRRHIEGMQLALDELHNTAAGRQMQLLPADSAGNPDQAKTHVRRLVESDKVDVITGFTITPELTAVRDYLHEQKQVTIVSIAGWPPLTRDPKVRSPYIFRSFFCQGRYEFIRAK